MQVLNYVLAMVILVAGPAVAVEEGLTAQRRHFLSGGIGETERENLYSEIETHTTWIVTAKKGSGEYLAGVAVKIWNSSGKKIVETAMDGPWLFIDLDDGIYRIELTDEDQKVVQDISVRFYRNTRFARRYTFYFN